MYNIYIYFFYCLHVRFAQIIFQQDHICADPSGRALCGVRLRSLAFWDCGFENPLGHTCLYLVSVPEYLLSISDASETITYMETTFLVVALVCVPFTLVTNSQNVLLVSVQPSISTLRTILPLTLSLKKLLAPDFRRSVQDQKY